MIQNSLVSRDLPSLTAPLEASSRKLAVTRERPEPLLRIVLLRTVNSLPERLDLSLRAVHDSGAGVDDGADVRDDLLAVNDCRTASCLPETGGGVDVVVLDVAAEERGVGAAEVEDGAVLGELETELAGADGVLLDGGIEEGVLFEVGDGGESETQETVLRGGLELVGECGDGGQVLVGDSNTSNSDC